MFDHCLMGFHPSIATPSVLFVVWLGSGKECILGVAEPACRGHIYILNVYYGNICKIINLWFYAWYIWEISVIENQQNLPKLPGAEIPWCSGRLKTPSTNDSKLCSVPRHHRSLVQIKPTFAFQRRDLPLGWPASRAADDKITKKNTYSLSSNG